MEPLARGKTLGILGGGQLGRLIAEAAKDLGYRTAALDSSRSSPALQVVDVPIVGPVDDDLRYYLELRGVPPEDAERLIVIGFFQDVLDRSPVKGLAEQLGQAVAAKFARRSA